MENWKNLFKACENAKTRFVFHASVNLKASHCLTAEVEKKKWKSLWEMITIIMLKEKLPTKNLKTFLYNKARSCVNLKVSQDETMKARKKLKSFVKGNFTASHPYAFAFFSSSFYLCTCLVVLLDSLRFFMSTWICATQWQVKERTRRHWK